MAEKTDIYRVVGKHDVCGVKPGDLVELPRAQGQRLLRSGSVSSDLEPTPVPLDTKGIEVSSIETSDAVSDSDNAGHESPDSTESDN